MRYHHRFVVNAPLEAVRAFHSRSASMGSITPPPIIVQVHRAPPMLDEGDEMAFTLWMGPLPVRWTAQFSDVGPGGFTDTMVRGPFTRWEHRHSFVPIDDLRTEVIDTLQIEPSRHWFWGLVGRSMIAGLPLLFAWRARRTRALLESSAALQPVAA